MYSCPLASVLEKLRSDNKKVLVGRRRGRVSTSELRGVIVLHTLAESYRSSVATISSNENRHFFFQLEICADRYKEVWSAMSCTKQKRQRVEVSTMGWSNRPSRSNALIMELEQELASVNRGLVYIAGSTIQFTMIP